MANSEIADCVYENRCFLIWVKETQAEQKNGLDEGSGDVIKSASFNSLTVTAKEPLPVELSLPTYCVWPMQW